MKKVIALTVALAGCASIPQAPGNQTSPNQADSHEFNCQSGFDWRSGEPVVVTAKINSDGETGEIAVAGQTHWAAYGVSGFDRRWHFGFDPDGAANYAFVIEPSGEAEYYGLKRTPFILKQRFFCKQIY